jgi:hypothetical protein
MRDHAIDFILHSSSLILQSPMATLSSSDLPLCPSVPVFNRVFFDFLHGPVAQAESLYILGDLLDYWAGDDDEMNSQLRRA